ncbi:hypothetical protein MT349_14865 [Rathayibacter caricis]|uniref:hypothetical protein n=1 Tax=Rathayibacter caricis TaxID=110936 RepID=UPI001FB3F6C1|nr:hypothetical protein [Rathayibacter caricis]MCJ1697062.1 hypothetical protein [Rathayibacter caricis]
MEPVAVDPLVSNYWSPVAQIVPVLAFAVVFEARRAVAHWHDNPVPYRVVATVAFLLAAFSLVSIENAALAAMSTGTSDPLLVSFSQIAIAVIVSAMCASPILTLAVASNADLLHPLVGKLPFSRKRRTARRLRKLKRGLREEVVRAEENERAARAGVRESEELVDSTRRNVELAKVTAAAVAERDEEGQIAQEMSDLVLETERQLENAVLRDETSRAFLVKAQKQVDKARTMVSEADEIDAEFNSDKLQAMARRVAELTVEAAVNSSREAVGLAPLPNQVSRITSLEPSTKEQPSP